MVSYIIGCVLLTIQIHVHNNYITLLHIIKKEKPSEHTNTKGCVIMHNHIDITIIYIGIGSIIKVEVLIVLVGGAKNFPHAYCNFNFYLHNYAHT